MKITFLFPSKSRPIKFFAALDNIKTLSASDYFEIIAVLDLDDISMNNEEVKERLKEYPMVRSFYGMSTGKINAINRQIKDIDGDTSIVCLMSDDFVFLKRGFDDEVRKEYADGFTGLLHFPDGHANERLCTFPIMDMEYLKRDGWIYHPKFYSVFADNFQQDLAKKRKCYKFVNNQIFLHKHYRWRLSNEDELYKRNDSAIVYAEDRLTYSELKKEFGIEKSVVYF